MTETKQRASRIAVLRERWQQAEKQGGPTFDVPFRTKPIPLRRISIDTDFPLYRIQSGRTHRAQSEYLERHAQLGKDFFDDPEDPRVQRAQHELLLGMIGERELDTDLDDRGQIAPLVLTFDGYVVDGNRRLAALREAKKQYADAVVLPEDAQAREIYETEIELQMQRETKAPYDWVDQAVHIELGITKLGESHDVIARRMRMSKSDVLEELQKLELVRVYLAWLHEEGKIHKLPTAAGGQMKQAFEEMAQRFSGAAFKRKKEPERRMIRELCFAAIKRGAGYKEIRSVIKQLGQNAHNVSHKLTERRQGTKKAHVGAHSGGDHRPSKHVIDETEDDPLRAFAGETSTPVEGHVQDLIDAASEEGSATTIMDIVEELEAEDRESKRQQQPLQRIESALSALKQIVIDEHTENLDAIGKGLHSVIEQVEKLSAAVDKVRSRRK
jgi:hypothetical protein